MENRMIPMTDELPRDLMFHFQGSYPHYARWAICPSGFGQLCLLRALVVKGSTPGDAMSATEKNNGVHYQISGASWCARLRRFTICFFHHSPQRGRRAEAGFPKLVLHHDKGIE